MKKDHLPEQNITRYWLYKLGILIFCTGLIVYFLPRESEYNFQFEEGRPWPYSQLMADFDFPIYKSEDLIAKETDSIMRYFTPYFAENDSLPQRQLFLLKQRLEENSPNDTRQQRLILNAMRSVFQQGIMDTEQYSQLIRDSIGQISIYRQREAFRRPIGQVYSTKAAYEFMNSDSLELDKALMRQCKLAELLVPNLEYDNERSSELRNDLISSISFTSDMVFSGTKIVDRGEIVTPTTYRIIESWIKESNKRYSEQNQDKMYLIIGQTIFVALHLLCFILFISMYRNDYFDHHRNVLLVFGLIVLFSVLTSLMVRSNWFSVYAIPFAMVPITLRILMDSRTAFTATVVMSLLCSISLRFPYEFILIQILSGLVCILSLREMSQRSQLFRTVAIITAVIIFFYFGFHLIHENDITKLDVSMYKYFLINGVLLLFTYPMLYMLEKTFGFTSDVTLVELSNINNPLLQKLSEVAPGTFQHSMQVANLAAEVAKKIGARPQLVRTGALYHDIGKLKDPVFFTENQSGINPHNSLDEMQSAAIIIDHVHYGLKLAEKHSLPQVIRDFIRTHHGAGLAKFFYINYQNRHPEEEVSKEPFTYPGPNPFTKEQAILMMADAVEASSRSLKEYTEESISNQVDKIVDGQVAEGYFKECPITFLDIAIAKRVFKERLKTVYHTRISYPELRK